MKHGDAIYCRIPLREEKEKGKEGKRHLSSVLSSNFPQALLRRWHDIRLESENMVHEFAGESLGKRQGEREREKKRGTRRKRVSACMCAQTRQGEEFSRTSRRVSARESAREIELPCYFPLCGRRRVNGHRQSRGRSGFHEMFAVD